MKKLILLALTVFALSCRSDDTQTAPVQGGSQLARTKLALNWYAEAEHGGYLAAKAEGLFEKAGLDVEIIPGGPDVPVIQRVVAGEVDFGIANADEVLLARNQQVPVVALMAPIQHTPLCIMVHEESGIEKLEDLKNVTLAIAPTTPQALYLSKKLKLENVHIVPYGGSVAPFVADEKFAQQGYVFSEPFVAKEKGAKVRCISVSTIGFDPYSSLLITSEDTLKKKAWIAERMVKTSVEGWQKYLDQPDATNKYIRELNPQMNDAILKYGHALIQGLVRAPDTKRLGEMTHARWQQTLDQLVEIGLIPAKKLKAEDAFTTRFLSR